MLSCALPALSLAVTVVVCFSVRSFAEQQLLCSSNSLSVWWEYEGPLYHFSISTEPCTNGMDIIIANYTVITKFTVARAGYNVAIYYKNQQWVEFFQPPIPCKELKICSVLKGETLSESLWLPVHPYYAVEGEYSIYAQLNIIDDLEREITIIVKSTMHVRNSEGEDDLFHHAKAP